VGKEVDPMIVPNTGVRTRAGLWVLLSGGLVFMAACAAQSPPPEVTETAQRIIPGINTPPPPNVQTNPGDYYWESPAITDRAFVDGTTNFAAARYEDAMAQFTEYVAKSGLSRDQQIEGLFYLAKSQWALGNLDDSRSSVARIHKLNPSFIPEMRKICDIKDIYFDVFGASLSPDDGVKTLSVLDFRGPEREGFEGVRLGIAGMLTSQLSSAPDVRVVERLRLDHILSEQNLTRENLVDAQTAARVGELVGAKYSLAGVFIRVGKSLRIDARLFSNETSDILTTAQVEGKADDLFELVEELGRSFAKELNVKVEAEKTSYHPPLEAFRAYVQGIESANRQEWDQATAFFQKALDVAPAFRDAEAYLLDIQPYALVAQVQG
jgi:TolB-like protein